MRTTEGLNYSPSSLPLSWKTPSWEGPWYLMVKMHWKKNYCQQKNSISTTFPWQPVFFYTTLHYLLLVKFKKLPFKSWLHYFFAFTRWENRKIYGGLIKKFQFAKYQSLKENVYLGWMNHHQISTSSLWKKPSYYRLNRFFLQTHRTKNSHNKVNWLKKDFFVMIQFQFSYKLELYFINSINGYRQKNGRL